MNVVFFSARNYDKEFFEQANERLGHTLRFLDVPLNETTAALARATKASACS